jgi:hypothetical protein
MASEFRQDMAGLTVSLRFSNIYFQHGISSRRLALPIGVVLVL